MAISKKLFLGGLVATASLAQATSMAGFNYNALRPYVEQAMNAVAEIGSKGFTTDRALYIEQKNAIKAIKKSLKQQAKVAKANGDAGWYMQRQLYKAFKKNVYKYWKKTQSFVYIP